MPTPVQYLRRRWLWPALDLTFWALAVFIALMLRYDFRVDVINPEASVFILLVLSLHLGFGLTVGPYAIGHVNGSMEETIDIGRTVALTVVPSFLVNWFTNPLWVPRSVPVIAGMGAILAMFGARFVVRLRRTRAHLGDEVQDRVIVFGAGSGGRHLVRSLVTDPDAHLAPVAILDDDPAKRRWRVDGVRVLGGRDDLLRVAKDSAASTLAVAIPSASSALLRELRDLAEAAGLAVVVLPRTRDLLGAPKARDLRSLDLADLLGRGEVELDATAIAGTVGDKVVLVTGAGGSIGSELCRQIARFGPARLVLLDRDESALHSAQISLTGRGLLDDDDTILADIRDVERTREIMLDVCPDVVFHAAALKHLPLLESYPVEAWKTNVLGTLNVLDAARAAGVEVFVNISTDKAANPTSVLGYSKRLTERLTAAEATRGGGQYVSVRFGNVLGSRGSVISAFTQQIERGGPVTVTHPDVERYFMLIAEACQLVLQAASIGGDGRVMVLNMGEQAKILDVAKTLIGLSGRGDVDIVFTGLRPGEKLSEELFSAGEQIDISAHPLVSYVDVPPLFDTTLHERAFSRPESAAAFMRAMAITGLPADQRSGS